ncbi:MAG: hypothetical protein EZS28_027433 [Streblomastix strix]|uniref:Uncharacterized protein n=1 Tax=Streblomastix strix TaxID=222440 RepID=A0A5J4V4I0_9EUKA|nr:MAG: hypothetical protein EZS28_027433 [Streblomastix strix]
MYIRKSQKNLQTVENLLKTFTIQPFQNDEEHYFSTKEIKPKSQLPSLFDKEVMIRGTFIFVGLKNSAELTREYVLNHRGKTIDRSLQNYATTESFIYNTIKPQSEKNNNRFFCIQEISDTLAPQTASPYVIDFKFTHSIPLDDLVIFSAFFEYPNNLSGDLKIKFKINSSAFVFCQVDLIQSVVKYYLINKDKLLSSGQDKLKDIDLFFRNLGLTFQYINMYTQIGCAADFVSGIRAEELTPS